MVSGTNKGIKEHTAGFKVGCADKVDNKGYIGDEGHDSGANSHPEGLTICEPIVKPVGHAKDRDCNNVDNIYRSCQHCSLLEARTRTMDGQKQYT